MFLSRLKSCLLLLPMLSTPLFANSYTPEIPLKIPLFLSGNFGELRSNHFHSGIDFKTQGRTGLAVYSMEKGWISRIAVSPWGYGKALYITHPNGMTSVYAHLDSFSGKIAKFVEEYQYNKETFSFDTKLKKGELPVERGEMIARSGNSGSSGGPHVHFEIRDTESEDPIDPLPFFMEKIKDTRKPEIRNIRLFPINGVVNGGSSPITAALKKREDGTIILDKSFTAWGEIGFGLKAYDKMDGTSNIYGVKQIKLFQGDKLIFSMENNRFSFDETRYINSITDYADWKQNKSMVMKMFLDPGNHFSFNGKIANRGIVRIEKEKTYTFRYELQDAHGNTTRFEFGVKGVKQEIPKKTKGDHYFRFDRKNNFESEGFRMEFPKGALYEDLDFKYVRTPSKKWHSDIHKIHESNTPLHVRCPIRIALTTDTLADKSNYFLAVLRNGAPAYVDATYKNGAMETKIRDFGSYVIHKDETPPVVKPFAVESWGKTGILKFKISDARSGIREWRGEVDGKFAIFEFDGKTATLSYKIDKARLNKTKTHKLILHVKDNCGNVCVYKRNFTW